MKNIVRQFLFFYKSEKTLFPPKKNDLLLYDNISSEKIKIALNNIKINILNTRGEEINIFILLMSIIRSKGRISFQEYVNYYIKYTMSKVVISFLDVDKKIINLKKANPKIKLIAIQVGMLSRTSLINIKKNIDIYEKVFLFSDSYKHFFLTEDQKKIIVHGSLFNNLFADNHKNSSAPTQDIYFISQLREFHVKDINNSITINNRIVDSKDFYKAEEILLPFISKFCEINKLNLHILGSFHKNIDLEINYYEKLIGNSFQYHKKDLESFHYKIINENDFFVSIDSALGYEALSKYKKICLFPIRGQFINQDDRTFGWPSLLPGNGEFWANNVDFSEFERVLNYVISVDNNKWENLILEKYNSVISYDKNNTKINKVISSLTNANIGKR